MSKLLEMDGEAADNWRASQRTKTEQGDFKDALVNYYDRGDPQNPGNIFCMVLNWSYPPPSVKASHICKHADPSKMLLYGLQPSDINSERNGLLLAESFESAFDVKRVCFVMNKFSPNEHERLILHVLDTSLRDELVFPIDIEEVQGPSRYGPTSLPARQAALSSHICISRAAFVRARRAARLDKRKSEKGVRGPVSAL